MGDAALEHCQKQPTGRRFVLSLSCARAGTERHPEKVINRLDAN
jgi:hypothetical protein